MAWACLMVDREGPDAELVIIQVVAPEAPDDPEASSTDGTRVRFAASALAALAERHAGPRGRARVVLSADPAAAVLEVLAELTPDLLVVDGRGMGNRMRLGGNVANRLSHNATCNVVIVRDDSAEPPVPEHRTRAGALTPLPRVPPRYVSRSAQIAAVAARFGLHELSDRGRTADHRDRARRLCAALEELGPTFSKLGQILSTRPDLLPPVYIEQLATLQSDVPPLPEEEALAVVAQELGVPWQDVFDSLDPKPLAAGTIGQVHRAVLSTGERVVVKVQRPTARDDIMQDLALLQLFAEKTRERAALRRVIDVPAVFEALSGSLQRELDFRQEASNLQRMAAVLEPYFRLAVPRLHPQFTSARLLVMEEVHGVPLHEAPPGPERAECAKQLLSSYYRQILRDGFFHADPHPGNMMWAEGRIYLLDLGMVGEVDPDLRERLLLLLMAFANEDVSFLADIITMLPGGPPPQHLDVDAFERELGELLARFRHASLREMQLGPILQGMTEISLRYSVPLPASLAMTGKALAQVQLATAALDDSLDPFQEAGAFVSGLLRDRARSLAAPARLLYEAEKFRIRAGRVAVAIERLTGARAGGSMRIEFSDPRLETTLRRVGRGLALSIATGAALLGGALMSTSPHLPVWPGAACLAAGALLGAGLVVDLLRGGRRG